MHARRAPACAVGLALVVGAVLLLAPGAHAGAARDEGGGARVATARLTFVDHTRTTPATPGHPATRERTLPTVVRYPRDAEDARPLIVLVHGLNGDPGQISELSTAWAAAGYVVATPRLPRTNVSPQGRAAASDIAAYPADVSFVITRLLRQSASGASGPLRGRIDAHHIGAGGISLGGMTVYGLISNTCCEDRRIDAAILMSAVRPDFPRGHYGHQRIPVMLVHGDADIGYHWSVETYPALAAPKWFVTLTGGSHGPPFEDDPDEHDDLVRATTTAFWDRYLRGDGAAGQRLVDAVEDSDGAATLRRDLG